uniref:Putative a receptor for ubiquitination targets n=1 Tax=Amblyomma aureolatum TaxID=187763 RepID=A0A1E1X7R7_9ACAR
MKHVKRFLFFTPNADLFPLMDLPEQLIEYVLSFLDHKDLLNNCRHTCKLFRNIIDSNSFWKNKCLQDGKVIPAFSLEELPPRYYQRIYIGNPYGRNLLRNGHGDSPKGAFAFWQIIENGGDGWKYEENPDGTDALPLEKQGCFATSYGPCTKQQVINLVSEGILPVILDNYKPDIEVSEWYAARFDCGSEYRLTVSLLNDKRKVLHEYSTDSILTEQWMGNRWSQVTHVFRDYPAGVRFVRFQHSGTDTQFWAGHYGSKMAGGVVCIRGQKQEATDTDTASA